jgi:hypothetical protein
MASRSHEEGSDVVVSLAIPPLQVTAGASDPLPANLSSSRQRVSLQHYCRRHIIYPLAIPPFFMLPAYLQARPVNKGIFQITDLSIDNPEVYKAKKFACRSLKGRGVQSGIRVIYAYFEAMDKIELVEIYYKGDKENEDRQRIMRYYGKPCSK